MTPEQGAIVEHHKAFNVPASWFVGTPVEDGTVEVVAIGATFVWSIVIAPDGNHSTSEAPLGEFSTGIEV